MKLSKDAKKRLFFVFTLAFVMVLTLMWGVSAMLQVKSVADGAVVGTAFITLIVFCSWHINYLIYEKDKAVEKEIA